MSKMITTKTGLELLIMSEEFTTKKYTRKDIVREIQYAIPKIEEEAVAAYKRNSRRSYPPKVRIEDEIAGDCEWETFTVGSTCLRDATKVVIAPQPDDPDFHWAHLCDIHIQVWEDDQRREG